MRAALAVFGLLASVQPLTPQRGWLERFALVVPGPQATRWLLVADVACLVGLGLRARRPAAAAESPAGDTVNAVAAPGSGRAPPARSRRLEGSHRFIQVERIDSKRVTLKCLRDIVEQPLHFGCVIKTRRRRQAR